MIQLVSAMCQRVVNLRSLNNTIQYTILLILGACACLSHAWHLGPQLQVISLGLVAQLMPHDLGLRMSYMSYAPLGLASTGHTICMPNTSTLAHHILLGHSKSRLLGNQLATDRPRQLNPPRSPEPSSACLRSETSLRALNGRRGSLSDPGPIILRFSGRKQAATEQAEVRSKNSLGPFLSSGNHRSLGFGTPSSIPSPSNHSILRLSLHCMVAVPFFATRHAHLN